MSESGGSTAFVDISQPGGMPERIGTALGFIVAAVAYGMLIWVAISPRL